MGVWQYVPDFNVEKTSLRVLLDVDVDGKVGVDVAHLVSETSRDTDDQVVEEGLDSPEGGNVLPCAVMKLDVYDVRRWMREGD